MTPRARLPRLRLWMKLAALAAVGVVLTHGVHLTLSNRAATDALLGVQARIGATLARLLAEEAADALLVNDLLMVHEHLARITQDERAVRYVFVTRAGRVVASAPDGGVPEPVSRLREGGERGPIVIDDGGLQVLDLVEPILGELGEVRIGLDLHDIGAVRRGLATRLGLIALAIIGAGLFAALLVGRSVGGPLQELLDAADRFDPASPGPVPEVRPRGAHELAILIDRINRMMARLQAEHALGVRARQRSVETERLVALGSLVAGVAHEVNNPLAGLKNCVRRLERPDLPEPKRREYLELMAEGLGRIEDTVRRLLDFGRPHPPKLVAADARRLAQDSCALVRSLLERRGIRLVVEPSPGAPPVRADRRLVGQALVNLLLNAAYVTKNGGEVRVQVRLRPGWVGLSVADDGPGIPVEIRERVLDPFFTTKPEGEGTGLGLSVTRTVVDAHGGELAFEFPPEGGTLATVWLPLGVPVPSGGSSAA